MLCAFVCSACSRWTWGLFVFFPCSASPTQCRVMLYVSRLFVICHSGVTLSLCDCLSRPPPGASIPSNHLYIAGFKFLAIWSAQRSTQGIVKERNFLTLYFDILATTEDFEDHFRGITQQNPKFFAGTSESALLRICGYRMAFADAYITLQVKWEDICWNILNLEYKAFQEDTETNYGG